VPPLPPAAPTTPFPPSPPLPINRASPPLPPSPAPPVDPAPRPRRHRPCRTAAHRHHRRHHCRPRSPSRLQRRPNRRPRPGRAARRTTRRFRPRRRSHRCRRYRTAGRPFGAVTYQRTPRQRLAGSIDRVHHVLLHVVRRRGVRCLGAGVRVGARGEGLHKLVVAPPARLTSDTPGRARRTTRRCSPIPHRRRPR
jgi:hypothetical protein